MNWENPTEAWLREMELEVETEGREWMRQRLEEKLQRQADRLGGLFPPSGRKGWHRRAQTMPLRSALGQVELKVQYGPAPLDRHWGAALRERWGLCAPPQLSPALEDKLAYFATVTGWYEAAAKLAAEVGWPVEDTPIGSLVQRLGQRGEAQI